MIPVYLKKINFENPQIISLVKDVILQDRLEPPRNRPHLEARAKLPINPMKADTSLDTEKTIELKRRFKRAKELHGDRVKSFTQYALPEDIETFIISLLPEKILRLDPTLSVQIVEGGKALSPHKDHSRMSSMFYLLSTPDVETIWWEKSEEFEEFDDLKYADPDKITPVFREVIDKDMWYIFNNDRYHSIHRMGGDENRVSFHIEFNVSAEELESVMGDD